MLDLKSPRWGELRQAYGSAENVPGMLEQLRVAPVPDNYKSEPWFSIWSTLCHQGDVYTATYAAVPHVVAMAKLKNEDQRLEHLNFIGYAEACRHHKHSLAIPPDLEADYLSALEEADALFLTNLKLRWGEEQTKVLLGGLAAIRGYPKLGEEIIDLDSSLFESI